MNNEDDLINRLNYYYKISLNLHKQFGGPSVYFHIEAIKEQQSNFLSDRHIEMIYAALASWGMHRMGNPQKTKVKMTEFIDFKNSITNQIKKFKNLFPLRMDLFTDEEYASYIDELKEIYCGLRVSISNVTIVAHSKTLAHILPNLIPPIDRQHTIRFFSQDNKEFFTKSGKYKPVKISEGIEAQFSDFKKYACKIKSLLDRCDKNLFTISRSSLNTSYPKIMDNLIMAFVKDVPKPQVNVL